MPRGLGTPTSGRRRSARIQQQSDVESDAESCVLETDHEDDEEKNQKVQYVDSSGSEIQKIGKPRRSTRKPLKGELKLNESKIIKEVISENNEIEELIQSQENIVIDQRLTQENGDGKSTLEENGKEQSTPEENGDGKSTLEENGKEQSTPEENVEKQLNQSHLDERLTQGNSNNINTAKIDNQQFTKTIEAAQQSPIISKSKIKNDQQSPAIKAPKFKLDIKKYEKFNKNSISFKANSLMATAASLKKNFPFKDHLKQMRKTSSNQISDVDGLDCISLSSNNTSTQSTNKVQETNICTDIDKIGKYFEISDTTVKVVDKTEKYVDKLMKKSVLPDDLERMEKCPKFFESKYAIRRERKRKAEETAGEGWFNLPKTEMTDEIKRDIQIIKMRGTLDGKHHYKRNDSEKLPKYFQVGTVVEGAHEFYSARVSKKARKRTMVDELLADAEFRKKNKKKVIEYQKKKASGGKGYYKQKQNQRKPTWART